MTSLANSHSDDSDARGRSLGMALIIVSSVMISFGGLVSRQIDAADASQINIYRALSTAAVALIVLLYRYRGDTPARIMQIGWPGLAGAAILSVAGIAFMQAMTTTTVANTLFTLSAIPFVTAFLAFIFLKERLSRVTLCTMILAAVGVGVMMGEGLGGGSLYGNLMALVTAVGFSTYAVIVRHFRHIDMLPVLLLSSIFLAAMAGAYKAGDWAIPWWDFWMCVIWGGLLSGIGNVMFLAASRLLLAAELTFFMLLEFALGPLWVWIFVNEVPSSWTLAGGVLIMAAVTIRALWQLQSSRRRLRRGRLPVPR
ncbi:MAG: DMT family transporter [Alphaproteobacteria bacterium]